jgi:ATP-dependent 26S proteasome regulatory subunit
MANEGLILLDDIDGAIIERSSNDNHEGRQTLPWLLTQLDRFSEDDCNIHRLIILCCNKLEYVDPALIRPGRFDRIITFKQPDNNIINNMINFVMKNDTNITDEIKQEIANFYENQHPNVSLADISLMGRLYYGGLVNSWMEAASWAINRGDSKQDDLIIKRNTNKVGF